MAANDLQIQNFSDQKVRPISEQVRNLQIQLQNAIASIDDVYAALTAENPTWTDNRVDGPAHLATVNDILAWNTFIRNINTAITSDGQWPIIQKLCIQ